MLRFWRNPEFVRHLRAQMRPMRAFTVAAVVLIVCVLVWMSCYGSTQQELAGARYWASPNNSAKLAGQWATRVKEIETNFYKLVALACFKWLLGIQAVVLTFWSMAACAQSVLGERDRKTWDFQRTTRLSPTEMVIGKLLGEPVLAYFILLCSLPASLIAGAIGGVSAGPLLVIYVVLIANGLFLGLGGLWLSTMLEGRSRGLFVIGALSLLAFSGLSIPFCRSHFPGIAAFSPYMEIGSQLNGFEPNLGLPTLFGQEVSWAIMSLLLYFTFGAWLALILVRNIKRDYPDIRPFTRWQALGFAAFLNFLIYALFRLSGEVFDVKAVPPRDLATWAAVMNGVILFVVGLATLTPPERLKVWWRERAGGRVNLFSEDGLPWPWIALSAIVAYALMIWGLLAWRHALSFDADAVKSAGIMMLAVAIFVIRDLLFLQWCMLTRLRQPVMKGFLYLCLYYVSTTIVGAVFFRYSSGAGEWVLTLLTPGLTFDPKVVGLHFSGTVYLGLVLQLGVIAAILMAIANRLSRPAMAPVLAAA